MLPIGKGKGELWKGNQFLCRCDYDISPPLAFMGRGETQRIQMTVHDYDCDELLNEAGLFLVLADGSRVRLPRPLNFETSDGYLECYLGIEV